MKPYTYFLVASVMLAAACSSNPEAAKTTHTHADGAVHADHDCADHDHHHHAVPEGQESFVINDDGSISLENQPHEHHHDQDHDHDHTHGHDSDHDHDHDHTHDSDSDHDH